MSDWMDDPLYDQRQEAESWRQAAEDELDDWDPVDTIDMSEVFVSEDAPDDRPDWWFDDDEEAQRQ